MINNQQPQKSTNISTSTIITISNITSATNMNSTTSITSITSTNSIMSTNSTNSTTNTNSINNTTSTTSITSTNSINSTTSATSTNSINSTTNTTNTTSTTSTTTHNSFLNSLIYRRFPNKSSLFVLNTIIKSDHQGNWTIHIPLKNLSFKHWISYKRLLSYIASKNLNHRVYRPLWPSSLSSTSLSQPINPSNHPKALCQQQPHPHYQGKHISLILDSNDNDILLHANTTSTTPTTTSLTNPFHYYYSIELIKHYHIGKLSHLGCYLNHHHHHDGDDGSSGSGRGRGRNRGSDHYGREIISIHYLKSSLLQLVKGIRQIQSVCISIKDDEDSRSYLKKYNKQQQWQYDKSNMNEESYTMIMIMMKYIIGLEKLELNMGFMNNESWSKVLLPIRVYNREMLNTLEISFDQKVTGMTICEVAKTIALCLRLNDVRLSFRNVKHLENVHHCWHDIFHSIHQTNITHYSFNMLDQYIDITMWRHIADQLNDCHTIKELELSLPLEDIQEPILYGMCKALAKMKKLKVIKTNLCVFSYLEHKGFPSLEYYSYIMERHIKNPKLFAKNLLGFIPQIKQLTWDITSISIKSQIDVLENVSFVLRDVNIDHKFLNFRTSPINPIEGYQLFKHYNLARFFNTFNIGLFIRNEQEFNHLDCFLKAINQVTTLSLSLQFKNSLVRRCISILTLLDQYLLNVTKYDTIEISFEAYDNDLDDMLLSSFLHKFIELGTYNQIEISISTFQIMNNHALRAYYDQIPSFHQCNIQKSLHFNAIRITKCIFTNHMPFRTSV